MPKTTLSGIIAYNRSFLKVPESHFWRAEGRRASRSEISHELDEEYAFDKGNKNDWRKSSLRKFLNEDYIEQLNRGDLLPFVSDLTADDGTTDYGTSEDYIFMLSDNLRRKYRPYLPKYDNWVWSITPYSCLPSYANYARIVITDGGLHYSTAFLSLGVAPACLFNPKIFE